MWVAAGIAGVLAVATSWSAGARASDGDPPTRDASKAPAADAADAPQLAAGLIVRPIPGVPWRATAVTAATAATGAQASVNRNLAGDFEAVSVRRAWCRRLRGRSDRAERGDRAGDANGEVCFYTYVPTDLIADVNGWFAA